MISIQMYCGLKILQLISEISSLDIFKMRTQRIELITTQYLGKFSNVTDNQAHQTSRGYAAWVFLWKNNGEKTSFYNYEKKLIV